MTIDGLIHIERPGSDYEASVTHVRMLCGASCVVFDDCHDPPEACCGTPSPDMDWVLTGKGGRATCPKCIELDHTIRSVAKSLETT